MALDPTLTILHVEVTLDHQGGANLYRGYDKRELIGVFVPTSQGLEIGRHVTLTIELDQNRGERLLIEGIVEFTRAADSDSAGVGIAFRSLSLSQRRTLNQFAMRRAPLFCDS